MSPLRSCLRSVAGVASAAPATLAVAATMLLAHAATARVAGAFDALVHADAALAAGEAWRLVSAHLVHLDAAHLLPNLVGLLALGLPLERRVGPRALLALLAVAGALVSLGVVLDPAVALYCGLSGALNALFAALCVLASRRTPPGSIARLLWSALLAAGLAKIGWEWANPALLSGALAAAPTPWPPHVPSHLVGYLVGAAWGLVAARGDGLRTGRTAPPPLLAAA